MLVDKIFLSAAPKARRLKRNLLNWPPPFAVEPFGCCYSLQKHGRCPAGDPMMVSRPAPPVVQGAGPSSAIARIGNHRPSIFVNWRIPLQGAMPAPKALFRDGVSIDFCGPVWRFARPGSRKSLTSQRHVLAKPNRTYPPFWQTFSAQLYPLGYRSFRMLYNEDLLS